MALPNTARAVMIRDIELESSPSQIQLRQTLGQVTVISLVVLSIVSPPAIMWDPNSFYLKWEVALLPFILLIYAWLLLTGVVRNIQFNGMLVVGAVYSVAVAFSIWYGSVLLGQTVILRDFYEFPKLWLPVVFFTIACEARLSEAGIRRLLGFFSVAVVLVCLYGWGQWGGLGFANWLNDVYVAPEHTQGGLLYARRVYSTLGNPNLLGMLMTWSTAAFVLAFLLRVGNQTRNLFLIAACLVTLTMTGSRYGLIDTVFAVVLVAISSFGSPRPRLSRLALSLLLIPVFASSVFLLSNTNQRTLERFQTLSAPAQTDSFRDRADQLWLDALDSFYQSPFLGRGPAKLAFENIVTDSEFLDVLKKFGLFGFLAYLGFYFVPLYLIWRGMRAARTARADLEVQVPATFLLMRLGFVMVLTALAMNIGMSTFYNAILQSFLFLWLGLAARAAQEIRARSLYTPLPTCLFPSP